MSLVTRCAACGTAFRVHAAQLSARGGKVRCGRCAAVFDAIAGLVEEKTEKTGSGLELTQPGMEVSRPDASIQDLTPFRLAWGLAAAAALVALALQALFYYRTGVAVLFPETRPYLAAACAWLGCELRLPRRPDLMSIESSDLQSDNRREGAIVLNAVIRNRAPFAQEHPALELTLTDERDQAVLRRVLAPADYLHGAAAERLAQGIAAGAETALRVHFDTSGVRAVGYRLYLFFP